MSSIGTALLNSLRSVERSGDFCVGGIRDILMPTIDVDGVGRIAFPILPVQADCVHEVRAVRTGCRLTLVYNLCFVGKGRPLKAPDYRAEHGRVVELLQSWASTEDEPDKLILPLEHVYTTAELSFSALKGADAGVASVLVKAAAEADCDLHLALVSIEESGSAEHTGYYGRRRRDDDDDSEAFEVAEVIDRALLLSEWRRPDGGEAGFGDFPFAEDELCPPDAFEDPTPDGQP